MKQKEAQKIVKIPLCSLFSYVCSRWKLLTQQIDPWDYSCPETWQQLWIYPAGLRSDCRTSWQTPSLTHGQSYAKYEKELSISCYTRCPQKSGKLDFRYFEIRKYSTFWLPSDKILSSEKNTNYQDHMIWFGSIDSTTISWNTVIYDFFFKNPHKLFIAGITVHKFFLCFVRWSGIWATMYGSQKNHYPCLKCHENEEKFDNDHVLKNDHRLKITQPISMILVSFFSEDNVISDEIQKCYIFLLLK